jgi:hypothetical protein
MYVLLVSIFIIPSGMSHLFVRLVVEESLFAFQFHPESPEFRSERKTPENSIAAFRLVSTLSAFQLSSSLLLLLLLQQLSVSQPSVSELSF